MGRSIGAVLAGAVVWSVLYQITFPVLGVVAPDVWANAERIDNSVWLLALLGLTVCYSVLAGYVTGWVAAKEPAKHALWLGLVQLGLGLVFEIVFWNATPVWYHLIFLTLLVPGNVYGGMLREKKTH